MRSRALVSVGLFAIGLAGCSDRSASDAGGRVVSSVPAPPDVMGQIIGANVRWGDFHSRGDAAGLASLYTTDAVLMTARGDVKGRPAIQQYFDQLIRERPDSILRTNTATETVDVAGNRAYEVGTIIFTVAPRRGGPAEDRTIRYMNFWQQETDGRWLIRYSLRPSPSGP